MSVAARHARCMDPVCMPAGGKSAGAGARLSVGCLQGAEMTRPVRGIGAIPNSRLGANGKEACHVRCRAARPTHGSGVHASWREVGI